MRYRLRILGLVWVQVCCSLVAGAEVRLPAAERVVILKVDGLNEDLLASAMRQKDDSTGKPRLAWLDEIFAKHGVIFSNFYTRGISLSAPSWSLLDTGHHLLIKGNVEYDRYTGSVYDYLNFFPFYLDYARKREADMPSVRVLDDLGIPLLIDAYPVRERYQSFQLFQRGVRWSTLQHGLQRRLSGRALLSLVEDPQSGVGLGEGLAQQTEQEVMAGLARPEVRYLDLFTGDVDHIGHSVNDPRALTGDLVALDRLAGRLWNGIQATPDAARTLFVMVSDHGMNNVPSVYSQTFSLPDLFNSTAGGAHHVITNRHQLSDYKIAGLDPLVNRVVNPSTASFYLRGQANEYPTVWLDLDGNERASVSFRESDLNRIHIVLTQLQRDGLAPHIREAAARYLESLIGAKRKQWQTEAHGITEELGALDEAIASLKAEVKEQPKKWTPEQYAAGLDKEAIRKSSNLTRLLEEQKRYRNYVVHLEALLAFHASKTERFEGRISDLILPMSLGDQNRLYDLQHYVVGLGENGLVLDGAGNIDEQQSFRYVNYFPLFSSQQVRNNPQPAVGRRPIDFAAVSLPVEAFSEFSPVDKPLRQVIWLYRDERRQLLEFVRGGELIDIKLMPVADLKATDDNHFHWQSRAWGPGVPFELFEDEKLHVPVGASREEWLSAWHNEREWLPAIHECRYSNGVIGITEELLAPKDALGWPRQQSLVDRFKLRRRNLVQPDLELFAADHWNFNTRNFNPGGNHGSFLRISTHSVWMMSGAGLPWAQTIEAPADSLNFASTILNLAGKTAAIPERALPLGAGSIPKTQGPKQTTARR